MCHSLGSLGVRGEETTDKEMKGSAPPASKLQLLVATTGTQSWFGEHGQPLMSQLCILRDMKIVTNLLLHFKQGFQGERQDSLCAPRAPCKAFPVSTTAERDQIKPELGVDTGKFDYKGLLAAAAKKGRVRIPAPAELQVNS